MKKRRGKAAGKRAAKPPAFFLAEPRNMFLALLFLFCALAVLFFNASFGKGTLSVLAACALGFFALELWMNWAEDGKRLSKALAVGVFLLLFDFAFENAGMLIGYWTTHGALQVGAVPVEVMAITLFGGAAWALYLPRKFDLRFSCLDVMLFAFFGALGEYTLQLQGVMFYTNGWNSLYAFISYAAAFALLHYVNYKVLK